MRRRSLLHNKNGVSGVVPNTFIGGVGATYPNAASFAVLINKTESDLQNYQVDVNDNISFFIDVDYSFISASTFYINNLITFFLDLDSHFIGIHATNTFKDCVNLKYFYAPKIPIENTGGSKSFANLGVEKLCLFEGDILGHFRFDDWEKIRVLMFPNLTRIQVNATNRRSLLDLKLLKRFYAPLCNIIDTFYVNVSVYSFGNVNNGCKFYFHPDLETSSKAYVSSAVTSSVNIGDTFTLNGLIYTCVSGTPTLDGEFQYNTNRFTVATRIKSAINADTRIGKIYFCESQGDDISIIADATGSSGNGILVSSNSPGISWNNSETFNGGGQHVLLNYLENSQNAIIVFKDDFTIPSAPISLSYTNLTATSVDLNFTPPTPNINGTDGYEVWIDDGVSIWQKHIPFDEIITSGDTLDLTGESLSGLKIKIRTIDGQMNYSPFTSEITISV